MLEGYSDARWKAMTDEQQQAAIKREADLFIHQAEMVHAGLAIRWAGLVYFLPLCHDAYGGNY